MLFKRKKRKSMWLHARDMIWPRCGWKRSFLYIKHRVLRLPHSTHDIAMGLAAGCVVSWTPVFGFHILQCFVFCKIVRANFLASLLGTTFGNPWTFPFLLWTSYQVGRLILVNIGHDNFIDIGTDKAAFLNLIKDLGDIILLGLANLGNHLLKIIDIAPLFTANVGADVFSDIYQYSQQIFLPTLIGGYLMAVLTFPLFYYGFYYMIQAARVAKTGVGKTAHVITDKVHDIVEHRKEVKENKKK